jgi:hypothetical protein
VGSCSLQRFDIFGVEFCALQFFLSGLFPLQIGVHEVKRWSAFGLTLFLSTPKINQIKKKKKLISLIADFQISLQCLKNLKKIGEYSCGRDRPGMPRLQKIHFARNVAWSRGLEPQANHNCGHFRPSRFQN